MKRILLSAFAFAQLSLAVNAQSGIIHTKAPSSGVAATSATAASASKLGVTPKLATATSRCGTIAPPAEWDNWFNKQVEQFKADLMANRVQLAANYTIPVIVHVLHNGDAVGVKENISAAQVKSQIDVLNADFNGTGLNVGNCPAPWQSLVANCGITFCLAKQDQNGNNLAEDGIDRINWTSKSGWQNPASFTDFTNLINHFNNVVKPQSIWDPTKYFNFWVADFDANVLLGFGNFPTGTNLSGLTSGAVETATTAGCLAAATVFGNTGIAGSTPASALYDKGRTITHEIGHNFGLRHIWGDAQCGDDYCADTPPAAAYNLGIQSGQCVSFPYHAGTCTGNGTNGEMTVNFMDYTNDDCMFMFTNDQKTRMLTALTQGTYRAPLLTSTKCQASGQVITPVANFSANNTTVTVGQQVTFTDLSSGPPSAWTWTFTGGTPASSSVQSPTISYSAPGTYNVSLTVSNTAGNNTATKNAYITVVTQSAACDTVSNFTAADTATYYTLGKDQQGKNLGYVSGQNTYLTKAKAEKFSLKNGQGGFKVTAAYLAFAISKGSSTTKVDVWDNTGSNGTPGATPLATTNLTNTSVTPGQYTLIQFPTKPTVTSSYYIGIELNNVVGDTMVLYTKKHNANNTNTAWEQTSANAWVDYSTAWQLGQGNPLKTSHYIVAIVCPPTGLGETMLGVNTSVYPNPTTGEVMMDFAQLNSSDVNVKVYTLTGQVVESTILRNVLVGTYNVNLSHVPNGVYFIQLNNGTETTTKRIVVSH